MTKRESDFDKAKLYDELLRVDQGIRLEQVLRLYCEDAPDAECFIDVPHNQYSLVRIDPASPHDTEVLFTATITDTTFLVELRQANKSYLSVLEYAGFAEDDLTIIYQIG